MTGDREQGSELRKRQRGKNLVLLAALAGFVVLVYVVSLVRMGGS
ncbi:MAG: hypothetical protein QNJ30_09765 [Kiloniellales bacterium]|nr:hypothetical protein [Kiloniellales bacterium]